MKNTKHKDIVTGIIILDPYWLGNYVVSQISF